MERETFKSSIIFKMNLKKERDTHAQRTRLDFIPSQHAKRL